MAQPTALAGDKVEVLVVVVPSVIWLPTSNNVDAYVPMKGNTVPLHPASEAVQGVMLVPGRVYPAAQVRMPCEPFDVSVPKLIQLIPLKAFTFTR